jgi:ABC-2 type transport system permease protein
VTNDTRLALRTAAILCRREIVRFVRQPARVLAAIGTPALLWLLLASGFAESMGRDALPGDVSYAAFLLPGMMTLVAVFAAVFSSISIIEERQGGWLQSVLVSPAPRWSIALGKSMGGAIVGWTQAALLLTAVIALDITPGVTSIVLALAALALVSVAMAAMGVAFAWRSRTTGSFHAVMNLLFLPMWMLSGAFFPAEGAAAWMRPLVLINPLTWATQAIRGPLLGEPWGAAMGISAGFVTTMLIVTTLVIRHRDRGA